LPFGPPFGSSIIRCTPPHPAKGKLGDTPDPGLPALKIGRLAARRRYKREPRKRKSLALWLRSWYESLTTSGKGASLEGGAGWATT